MSILSLLAILLCFASVFGFVNERLLHLPRPIGLMIVTLFASFCVVGIDAVLPGLALRSRSEQVLQVRELPNLLFNGALSFLLFAGAMQVDLAALWSRKLTVTLLATVGVAIATALFGLGIRFVFVAVGIDAPLLWCMVLGAVLAPTDPVAIAGMLSSVALPTRLKAVLGGESLFNDGVGVVVFSTLLALATTQGSASTLHVALEFGRETGGGLLLGAVTGWIAYLMMAQIDEYVLEIMITLALTASTYALANALGASGPIAVVVSGLLIGNRASRYAMSDTTRQNLRLFWSVVDEILNALLFLLLGFEVLSLAFDWRAMAAAALSIPLALAVRAVSVLTPIYWLHARNPNRWRGAALLTWGGLRGGISVALALSLPPSPWRGDILLVCYAVVVFTIVVQGLTMQRLLRVLFPKAAAQEDMAE